MWKKSSFCKADEPMCVEVRICRTNVGYPIAVDVRDSKEPASLAKVLTFTTDEWQTFIDGVKAGEFDLK